MNKKELVSAIASETGAAQTDAAKFLDAFVKVSTGALKKGDGVQLIGFGSFSIRKRAATTGRNPATGASIKIPAKNVVKFTAGKQLKDTVN